MPDYTPSDEAVEAAASLLHGKGWEYLDGEDRDMMVHDATRLLTAAVPLELQRERERWEAELREKLVEHYFAGAEGLRRFRLRIGYDESGREIKEQPLPEHLCGGDMLAALRCVKDVLAAALPTEETG